MMVRAGSIDLSCSVIRYNMQARVAIITTYNGSVLRYSRPMFGPWIRRALEEKGMSQAALGRALTERLGRPIDRAAVNKMVKETRAVAADELVEIARITGCQPPVEGAAARVPLIGFAGAGAEAILYSEGQGPFEQVEGPDGSNERTVAVEIRGASLGLTFDGWRVFYDDIHHPPHDALLGRLCVVGLDDGRIVIKKLTRGQLPGRYTLEANTEPPIYDVAVTWAAAVKALMPK